MIEGIQIHTEVVPMGSPKKVIVNNGVMCRFGFVEIPGSGLAKCASVLFARMPEEDVLRDIVTTYNHQHGIHEEFVPAEYGY